MKDKEKQKINKFEKLKRFLADTESVEAPNAVEAVIAQCELWADN